jgi:ribosome biogenesis protein MAK21
MGRKPPLDEEPATMEPATLQPNAELFADVKAFAAQLGFGSGGDGDDAFADFAPGKAKKKLKTKKNSADALKTTSDTIATTSAKVSDAPSSNGHHGAAVNNKSKKRPSEAEHQHPATAAHNAGSPAPPPKRQNAVASAGPAPRSLLRNDEPGLWWEHADALPSALRAPLSTAPSQALVEAKRRRGEELLEAEAAAFEAAAERQRGGSSLQWLQQAQKGGTTADKVAAMAVLVQESPAANLRALDGLLTMAGKKGGARAVVGSTLDVLRELWEDVLLPRSRKLRYLEQQPLDALSSLSAREADRALLLWTVEDGLKKRYAAFVESLDALSRDNLDFVKDRALKVAFDLLTSRPEQEAALLSALVNKLGDPGRKLASKAGYFLMRLLSKHPGMKTVVVREIERFVFRPGLADRARYYAVVYLNQMTLTHRDAMVSAAAAPNNKTNNDSDKKKKKKNGAEQGDESGSLARRMVDLYFTLFKLITEGKLGTSASLAQAASDRKRREQEAKAARRGKKKFKSGKVDASRVQRASVQPQDAEGKGEEEQDNNDKHYHRAAQSGEIDSRMLSALITGVRRAFPYVAAEEVEPLIEAHTGERDVRGNKRKVDVVFFFSLNV